MKDEALKLALEALEKVTKEMLACRDELAERGGRPISNVFYQRLWDSSFDAYTNHAMPAAEAIKQALAAPVQEPVAWGMQNDDGQIYDCITPEQHVAQKGEYTVPLYTTPPAAKRTWTGLTDEEMYLNCPNWLSQEQCKVWIQQIEAKLKEKNQ
jgi:hypothetical protein